MVFTIIKKHEGLRKINIKPDLPKRRRIEDDFRQIKEASNIYDQVIWIIDLDTIHKMHLERRQGSESYYERLIRFKQKAEKLGNVQVYINSPCLEYWFLLHYHDTQRYFESCEEVCRELKRRGMNDYVKSEKYYKNPRQDLYQTLSTMKSTAIDRAKNLSEFDVNDPEQALAEIFKIFGELGC